MCSSFAGAGIEETKLFLESQGDPTAMAAMAAYETPAAARACHLPGARRSAARATTALGLAVGVGGGGKRVAAQ
jgi:hypothetical protein